eukprot:gene27858-36704_t
MLCYTARSFSASAWDPSKLIPSTFPNSPSNQLQKLEWRVDSRTLFRGENLSVFDARKPQVPALQRGQNEDRIKEIYDTIVTEYYEKKNKEVPFLNALCLADHKSKLLLVDGQHRLEAYRRFSANFEQDFRISYFLVSCPEEEHVKKLFVNLNNHYKMDDIVVDTFFMDRRSYLIQFLRENYPLHLSTSRQPRFPNIFADDFSALVLKRFPEYDAEVIVEKVKEWNKEVGEYLQEEVPSFYEKAMNKQGFFLAYLSTKKPDMHKSLRVAKWEETFEDLSNDGHCYCCKRALKFPDFELGHKLARSKGGSCDISNLEVVCKLCNRSMGTTHMDDYKSTHWASRHTK